ncbi:MAG: thioredoxin domain-containing protein [Anaerolineae bacterium]|nr:thioredoxin domain-containing protein [Anaerolineae bacterium]
MNRRRWLTILCVALLLLVALPVLAQDPEPAAGPLDGILNFFGITPDMLEAASQPVSAENDLGALLATLPQWRTEDGAFVIGPEDAPFTLVEFADWACPHCITYERETVTTFLRDHVATGQAAFEFRPFPTAGGDTTVAAIQLLECAETLHPGAFWSSYTTLYEMAAAGAYNVDTIIQMLTSRLEVTRQDLVNCVMTWSENNEKPMQIQTDYEFALAAGVTGTPSVLVRFDGGEAQPLEWEGQTWNQGGVPLQILSAVIASVQPE